MRIVSGSLKGRRINAPNNIAVRPTTDFAKEALFNILNQRLDYNESVCLDLFAGIGSICLELISRGALNVHAVDMNTQCIQFIKDTAEKFNINNLLVFRQNAFDYPLQTKNTYDFIFADPPYQAEEIDSLPQRIFSSSILNEQGMFVLEHSSYHNFKNHPYFIEERKYGKVHFSFFQR